MFRLVFVLSALVAVSGCAKKGASTTTAAAADTAAAGEALGDVKVPTDDASKAFAQKLLNHNVTDFKPTDAGGGASFVYKTIDFRNDNTWWAEAQMSADGETIDCKEQGTWEMDPAQDEHTAEMNWTLSRTTCAGRPENNIMRVKVQIEKGEYKIVFR